MHGESRLPRWVFRGAGIYGVLVLLPQYLLEKGFGPLLPAPLTRPELLYGAGRIGVDILVGGFIDLALGALFVIAYRATPQLRDTAPAHSPPS